MRISTFGLVASLFLPTIAVAQNVSCSLSGTVMDATGASLAGIEAVLTDSQTGFVSKTRTNTDGFFSFASLTTGTFSLEIAAPGYRRYSETSIDVGSGEQRSLGEIRLKLGAVSETITVTAEASHVKLASGERSNIITGADLGLLAMRGGDIMDAVALLPGVVDTSNGREVASSQSMVSIFISGGRSNQKNMTVDGISNLDSGSNNSVQTMPSWPSIGEVQVLQSNYSAEYGRNSGGSITVITKGGGQKFHGLAAWSHRHEQFSANDFFNNQSGKPRARYRYNIFDYALGGPVFIPRVLDRQHSHLFFFVSQEFEEQRYAYGQKKIRVPTALERNGDFSQTFDVNRKLIAVHDPLNKGASFTGNRIPANRFSAIGQKILGLFPQPNYVDPNPSNLYQWNYLVDASAPRPIRTTTARIDYSPHSNTQFYARYSRYIENEEAPYGSGSNWDFTPVIQLQPGWSGTLHATQVFTPTLFGEFVFGVSQRKHNNYLEFPD
ncbi:MAG: carboxypeptidase regulatory-like domain-containing protein, partial [Acidobacteriota bacterium]|nr:carboxypeptidase regulatory-like domain-containing protein [Acidobacteriota bacterium]